MAWWRWAAIVVGALTALGIIGEIVIPPDLRALARGEFCERPLRNAPRRSRRGARVCARREETRQPVAVRSNDYEHVYFVAARVDGSPALCAMNRLNDSSLILSVNDRAYDVSGMGRGETTDTSPSRTTERRKRCPALRTYARDQLDSTVQPDGSLRCRRCGATQLVPRHSTARKLAVGVGALPGQPNEVHCRGVWR